MVVRILEAGRNRAQLSRELGVSTWSLTRWKKLFGEAGAGVGSVGRSPKGANGGDASAVQLASELAGVRAELYVKGGRKVRQVPVEKCGT